MEEDWGALAADSVVLSCCCQCLVLQVIVFIFLKIPHKLVQTMKKYVKRRLRGGNRRERKIFGPVMEEDKEDHRSDDGIAFDESQRFGCMEEIEATLQELSMNGYFVFGSFWGREAPSDILDFSILRYEITETNSSLSMSLLV